MQNSASMPQFTLELAARSGKRINSHGRMDPEAARIELEVKLNSIELLPTDLAQLNARERSVNYNILESLLYLL